MLIYAALLIGLAFAFVRLPGGFLPVDDQGFITTDVQTPSDSSYARTEAAVEPSRSICSIVPASRTSPS